jgi:single-strand DNA-binding protein
MNESWVTLQGWVGGEVTSRDANGVPVATFRLGCTPRYIRNGVWIDGQTSWYTVNAWRTLAGNVVDSVRKGEPVVVHGKMRADVWAREGLPTSVTHIVEATFVGHDLGKGTSSFVRVSRRERVDADDPAVREMVHALPADGPQLDSEGSAREAPAA